MNDTFFDPEIQRLAEHERKHEEIQAHAYTLQVREEASELLGMLSNNADMVRQWYGRTSHLEDARNTNDLVAELVDNKTLLTRWYKTDVIPESIGDTSMPSERDIMLAQAERNVYFSFWKIPEKYRNDRAIATAAVRANPANFDFVSERLLGNRSFIRELVEFGYIDSHHLSSISVKLRDDERFMFEIIQKHPECIICLSPRLQKSLKFLYQLVSEWDFPFELIPVRFQDHPKIRAIYGLTDD